MQCDADFIIRALSVGEGALGALLAALLAAILGFRFSARLQRKLIKERNKDKMIDMILHLLNEQSRLYVSYWERDATGIAEPTTTNQTGMQTRFDMLLRLATAKYKLIHTQRIEEKYKLFCKLSTGEDFGSLERKANLKKCQKIQQVANDLYVQLLDNKI